MTINTDSEPEASATYAWTPAPTNCVLACLGGAVVAGILLAAVYPFFPMVSLPEQGVNPSPELLRRYAEEGLKFYLRNYTVGFASIGACIGLAMGLGTARLPAMSAIAGTLGGAALGAASGYVSGSVVAEQFATNSNQSLLTSGIIHFVCWGGISVGCITPIAMINGGLKQAATGLLVAIIASLLVSVAWNTLGSIAFTSSDLSHAIPESIVERVVWLLLAAIVLAVVVGTAMKPPALPSQDMEEAVVE